MLDDLRRRGVTRCEDLASVRDGRHVEVVGIIRMPNARRCEGRLVHYDGERDRDQEWNSLARPIRG